MPTPTLRRLLHPIYRRLETAGHPLRYLFVEVTQRCNLECLHCGSDCTRETRYDELTTDEWLRFFAYVRQRFDPKELAVVVTGGEPLCHPEIFKLLGELKSQGLLWGMVTNGYALTPANVERLLGASIWSATVSLDGLAASHDWLRNRDGSFKRAVAGIERLVAGKLPNFDVVTCVNPKNLEELPQVYELLHQLGVPAWRLFSIFPKGRARENPELILSAAQFRRLLALTAELRAQHPGGMRVDYCCEGYLPRALDAKVRDEPYFCRAGVSIASVLCDGSISACPNIARDLIQGNVRRDDFVEVWEKRFEKFRDRRWMRQGECTDCAEFSRCLGNSMHLWDHEAGHTMLCTFKATTES
jgi:radical SAM enzyme (rSAM/lipoprotein system)